MIHRKFVTKNPFQSRSELCGKRYFRHQIEHLLLFCQGLFYQVDVEFGLAAGCYAVKQHRFFINKLMVQLVKSLKLKFVEWIFLFGKHFRSV